MQAISRIAVALVCLCSLSSLAQNSAKTAEPKASVAPQSAISEDARIKAIQEYWTPERLASARPMPLPRVDPASVTPANAPAANEPARFNPAVLPSIHPLALAEPSLERFPLNQGDEFEANADLESNATPSPEGFSYIMPFNNFRTGINNQFPYATMGKLFFAIPGSGNYVCSAAVVGSATPQTGSTKTRVNFVVTARHCMWDYASKKWYTNWVFYPEWNNGHSTVVGGSAGAWYPMTAITWTSGSAAMSLTTGYDIGIMIMHDGTGTGCGGDKGYQIGNYTGALGWTYGGDFSQRQWNQFGYPQAAPFEGNYLYQNNGATGIVNPLGSNMVVETGDPQTGGTSGGPWVIGFDPNNNTVPSGASNNNGGINYDNGVNSFVWTSPSQPLAMNGTVFQSANFGSLWNSAIAVACK